jgi:hypothetical protein
MRAGPLSNGKVIDLLNRYFVPVYIANEEYTRDGTASVAEKAARAQMLREAWKGSTQHALFMASDAACYFMSKDGHVVDALRLPDCLDTQKMMDMLESVISRLHAKAGKTLVEPAPQHTVFTPKVTPGSVALHLTARYIPSGGTWKQLPGEDIIVLEKPEWQKLLAPQAKVGTTWEVDKDVATKILSNFYPPTSNRDPLTNRIDDSPLKATVVSVKDGTVRVRLDCELKMKHRFLPIKDDDHFVTATVVGFVDYDGGKKEIKNVRMVTEKAAYHKDTFGVAVRMVQ